MNDNKWLEYERLKAAFKKLWPDCSPEVYQAFIASLTKRLGV